MSPERWLYVLLHALHCVQQSWRWCVELRKMVIHAAACSRVVCYYIRKTGGSVGAPRGKKDFSFLVLGAPLNFCPNSLLVHCSNSSLEEGQQINKCNCFFFRRGAASTAICLTAGPNFFVRALFPGVGFGSPTSICSLVRAQVGLSSVLRSVGRGRTGSLRAARSFRPVESFSKVVPCLHSARRELLRA